MEYIANTFFEARWGGWEVGELTPLLTQIKKEKERDWANRRG